MCSTPKFDRRRRSATIDHPRSRQHPSRARRPRRSSPTPSPARRPTRFAFETVNLLFHFSAPLSSWQNPARVDLHVPHSLPASPVGRSPRICEARAGKISCCPNELSPIRVEGQAPSSTAFLLLVFYNPCVSLNST